MMTTVESPHSPLGLGPSAAHLTAAMRFSLASEEPLSEDLWEPTIAIGPGGLSPLPDQAKHMAADDMCRVSVP